MPNRISFPNLTKTLVPCCERNCSCRASHLHEPVSYNRKQGQGNFISRREDLWWSQLPSQRMSKKLCNIGMLNIDI